MKKCARDSRVKQAADKSMHGTEKTSFTTKCEKDAMRDASDNLVHVVEPLNCPPNADAHQGTGCSQLHH